MPIFESSLVLTRPPADVFALYTQPAWLIQAMPPELSLRLIEAPERLSLGAKVVVAGRRWGVAHKVTTEVTAFETDRLVVEEQREGPFRSWRITNRFDPHEAGTQLASRVEFEPPGGILGLIVTEGFVRSELESVFAYRAKRLREWFQVDPPGAAGLEASASPGR